ncbi:MAG: LytTR family DNA-binding domain-containing protein [Solobacterium sp.]|nr:LytTR family DNA-binding domain-containing protein [Solobacterium sp.]
MLNIAVCDDNPIHLKKAGQLVKNCLDEKKVQFSVQPFTSAELLFSESTINMYMPDIAVLDIEMDGEDGISLAKKLNRTIPQCRIIFLTSYLDYAQDAYEAEHIWFVVKKDADRYFPAAMAKALRSMENDTDIPGIIVRDKGISVFVPADQILYISKVGRKAQIVCPGKEYYDSRKPAELISGNLNKRFIRCHQGYWVNVSRIKELDHDTFILENNVRIPISRTYKEEARKTFFDRYRD